MASRDSEHVALQFFGILFGGAVLTGLLRWVSSNVDLDPDAAAASARSWVLAALPYVVGVIVTLVALLVLRAWRRGRRRRRDEIRQMIAAALAPVMPADWDQAMVLVTKWRGFVPMRGRIGLNPTCRDDDPQWRDAVTTAIRTRLGAHTVEATWPKPATRMRRPLRITSWIADYTTGDSEATVPTGREHGSIGRYSHPSNSLFPP